MNDSVIRFEGRFDQSTARDLHDTLLRREAGSTTLDFSHVAEFDDRTLALLSANLRTLRRKGREVLLQGMRDHQLRLLDHLGVDVRQDGTVNVEGDRELPFTD